MFGTTKPASGGLFGSSLNTNTQQSSGGLFGSTGTNNQQNQQQQGSGSLFGNLGQSTQQNQNQGTGGLFGNLGQSTQNQQRQGGGLFGNTAQNQAQQSGGLFGQSQNTQQQQSGGLFGGGLSQNQNNQQQQSNSLFGGGLGQNQSNQQQQQQSGLFGSLGQSQNNQSQQNGLFGQSSQQNIPQLGQGASLWQAANNTVNPREKSIPDQMQTVLEKWDSGNSNCVFKHYFYNKVDDNMAPYYRPGPNEDPKAWEEALSKKPGPGYIPVLCVGFNQMGDRIKLQQRNLSNFNTRLHEINASLTKMMQDHETKTSIRTIDARRKHVVLKQRCLALATKVQVLRNRGYAMAGDEEDLRTKLLALEKNITDPGLGARGEEIWARMLIVQDRARTLRNEIEKAGAEASDVLDEETSRQAKKVLEDYNTQLSHLKGELESIHKEFLDWQKEQGAPVAPRAKETTKNDTQARRLQFV